MRPALLISIACLCGALGASPRPAAAAERPVVVELFTSQSCSSCPPAEALIGRLAQEGSEVLPLAFHVTYWNHLNWRDPYSLPAATARQEAYAARLGGSSYTPQAVIDGRVGLVGSDEAGLRAAIARARAGGPAIPMTLVRDDGRLVAQIGPGSPSGSRAGRVLLVGFDPSRTTKVLRGENAGRTIEQVNIVRSVQDLGSWSGAAETFTPARPDGEAAALLLQAEDGRFLGAARLGPSGAGREALR
ncbi:DUF1223 domain-containing protein [Methylobacterium longum]|jgi:hypothetical protein|uniref:DUF1223 domain-containing protein n=1 Tax=Methylobacterium longum TaxID=767694 RepID=A0ABT8AXS1_9HYPH|nr:DUF1223 domain-containing protein [Methylobacterium longum]MDN3574793.1 DUF1223 domain-containing protein [Methylobacterium longum]GJE11136.1 hypothetical protein FOHLNKBM_2177 [Methylobacterium longum]